ncbi:hypothetical protein HDK64DRAFT_262295, partial [Phyllosticta capitalensis]
MLLVSLSLRCPVHALGVPNVQDLTTSHTLHRVSPSALSNQPPTFRHPEQPCQHCTGRTGANRIKNHSGKVPNLEQLILIYVRAERILKWLKGGSVRHNNGRRRCRCA